MIAKYQIPIKSLLSGVIPPSKYRISFNLTQNQFAHILSSTNKDSWEIMLMMEPRIHSRTSPYGLNRLMSINNWREVSIPNPHFDGYYGHVTGLSSEEVMNYFKAWQQKKRLPQITFIFKRDVIIKFGVDYMYIISGDKEWIKLMKDELVALRENSKIFKLTIDI
ncbi:hypothetical protein [Macrococcus lamae]|uniref:Uncharacterized protein n=1 Tax=Macrococcus lamae TaxID=198484 RepID=A0A4R6BTA4_9STAP|nr:hypothetical protein [Macrococcus lamae]TDM07710.1 hypothetical protein ERX29_08180 [Macrococcus lamae]